MFLMLSQEFLCLSLKRRILVGHVIKQGRKNYSGRRACLTKENVTEMICYVLADVIIFVYEVPCIFWHYINVEDVSLTTLKKLLQSAMDSYYKLRQLFFTKCDTAYCKLRQVLQSAMIITNCDSKGVGQKSATSKKKFSGKHNFRFGAAYSDKLQMEFNTAIY